MDYQKHSEDKLDSFELRQLKFYQDVLDGLQKPRKELPAKYFYDKRGASLYERICSLDEYYIPRVESAIMNEHIGDIVIKLGPNVFLIEYGSGDCAKTHILLSRMTDLAAYAPIDISHEQLVRVAGELKKNYPGLKVLPVCADYTSDYEIPIPECNINRRVVYFPGSSIGNFEPEAAISFMAHVAEICQPGDVLLIGIDLKKDPVVLHSAYNDAHGVTADFNLNMLARINRELGADFQLDSFRHHAFYNAIEGRIEMHLVSLKEQIVHLDNMTIHFRDGESIHTENSYKYTFDQFTEMANAAGFSVDDIWTDKQQWFGILYLVNSRNN